MFQIPFFVLEVESCMNIPEFRRQLFVSIFQAPSRNRKRGSANRGTAIVPLSTIGTRYGNSVSTPYTSKTNGTQLTHHGRESKRKADTEIQYRPRIVDMDIDCGPRFCGPRFRDSYSELGPRSNKRCFLNGVFQSGVFRGASRSARAEGTKMLENAGIFRLALSLWRGLPLSQAKVRNLKNTV